MITSCHAASPICLFYFGPFDDPGRLLQHEKRAFTHMPKVIRLPPLVNQVAQDASSCTEISASSLPDNIYVEILVALIAWVSDVSVWEQCFNTIDSDVLSVQGLKNTLRISNLV